MKTRLFAVCVSCVVALSANSPAQEQGEFVTVAIPINVSIVPNQNIAIITGRFAETPVLQCAPGDQFAHSIVLIDPGGGRGSQRSEAVIFRSQPEPSKNGTRIDITTDGAPCNAEYLLYTGIVR